MHMYEIVTLRTQGALGSLVMTLHNMCTTTEIKTPTKNANYESNNNKSTSDRELALVENFFVVFFCFFVVIGIFKHCCKIKFYVLKRCRCQCLPQKVSFVCVTRS